MAGSPSGLPAPQPPLQLYGTWSRVGNAISITWNGGAGSESWAITWQDSIASPSFYKIELTAASYVYSGSQFYFDGAARHDAAENAGFGLGGGPGYDFGSSAGFTSTSAFMASDWHGLLHSYNAFLGCPGSNSVGSDTIPLKTGSYQLHRNVARRVSVDTATPECGDPSTSVLDYFAQFSTAYTGSLGVLAQVSHDLWYSSNNNGAYCSFDGVNCVFAPDGRIVNQAGTHVHVGLQALNSGLATRGFVRVQVAQSCSTTCGLQDSNDYTLSSEAYISWNNPTANDLCDFRFGTSPTTYEPCP
jgi:hypothetical protein